MSRITKYNHLWRFTPRLIALRRSEFSTLTNVSPEDVRSRVVNGQLQRLVQAYREHGHRLARLNPLTTHNHHTSKTTILPEMEPERYGLSKNDPVIYDLRNIGSRGPEKVQLSQVLDFLKRTYCGSLTFEYIHLQDEEEREWLTDMVESINLNVKLDAEEKKQLAFDMLKSQAFDKFVATKFPTLKRYSGEGAETAIVFFERLFRCAVQHGVEQVIIGLPHRGRLNLLTNLLDYPPANMFRKMKGMKEFPQEAVTTGDVLHHLTSSVDVEVNGGKVHVTMLPNPSHLEAVNPVAVGKARGRQMSLRSGQQRTVNQHDVLTKQDKLKVLPVQVHGDAAFAAQGIVMETLALSQVPQYGTGGSIHIVVNNQIGFTTPVERARSSPYCTDIAKMIYAPVIHVNGDCPEEVVKATVAAMAYRQKFAKDIFVDIVCFRRWGHNEIDDPTITNPQMYQQIRARTSIPDRYADGLVKDNVLTLDEISDTVEEYNNYLTNEFDKVDTYKPTDGHFEGSWTGFIQAAPVITSWDTGMDTNLLRHIGKKSVQVPKDFTLHPQVEKTHVQSRRSKLESGQNVDWATAESLAIGSMLYQGFDVRISGQDVARGTFSHRHAVLVDQNTEDTYIPLNDIVEDTKRQGYFEVANSILSEEAVMGFEYGMSIENPHRLVIWEAQFGDFFNGAQVIVDTFVTCGETKWLLQSGLVLLLPHGYDGAGPEHSSCRIERFLQLNDSKEDAVDGDDINMRVTNPTTPAQYFHLLRSQVVRNFRKPLIIASPKILLRLAAATSDLREFEPGTTFLPVIGDADRSSTFSTKTRVIFCSGKHYYALAKQREDIAAKDTAIIRLESLCPFPTEELQTELKKYPKVTSFVWSQEEPQNMGPWSFVFPRFLNLVGVKLAYSGRKPMATPAVGIGKLHQEEVAHILKHPFSDKS